MDIKNNIVLITGGATGIGFAMAKRFAEAGNKVIICGRRSSALAEAKKQVPTLNTIKCDLSKPAQRIKLYEKVRKEYPKLNVLVNNAGIQNRPPAILKKQDWAPYELEIATNFAGHVHLCLLFSKSLAAKKRSAIINITSGLAFVPIAFIANYCATKAAMHSFTMSLRKQLEGTSVEVIEVAPPAVNTDLGGKGLHDFGVPLDDFADHVMKHLAAGDQEFGYQFSENAMFGTKEQRDQMFARMNS